LEGQGWKHDSTQKGKWGRRANLNYEGVRFRSPNPASSARFPSGIGLAHKEEQRLLTCVQKLKKNHTNS
jgi:hypothetical protein